MPDVQTPDWVKDAVFYQIFPDRFAKSDTLTKPSNLQPWGASPTYHGYQGGDLIGVVEHLDYLVDLGINAIYFNPVFASGSNHRYHTYDYYHVDRLLGGNAALRKLIDAAHMRGIRVILDGVFNHASRGFFQFHDILENGPDSPYLDWFTVIGWPLRPYGSKNPNYQAWWNLPALPKVNIRTPAVREFIWDVAEHWIKFGVDGWRLDVPGEIDDDAFWQEFRCRVKAANPEAYIVGEVWGEAHRWLRGDQFDAVMNYAIARAALGFFAGETLARRYRPGGFRIRPLAARTFGQEVERMLGLYPWPITQVQLNLLDSHDTARFIHQTGGDWSALRLATLFLMTMPGAPCLYYGTEVGLQGGPDPDCRRAFPWDSTQWDHDLLAWTRRAVALRNTHPSLRHGAYRRVYAHRGVFAFAREDGARAGGPAGKGENMLVVFNSLREPRQVSLPVRGLLAEGPAADLWGGEALTTLDGTLNLSLAPRSAAVFAAPHAG
jgi:cyclomaltodextrinase / maltogenic alpha-amylase / neopullulanase